MAEIWAAAATVAVGVYSANQQKKASEQGLAAQQGAADAATAEQRRQYDQNRQDQMPWLQAGQWAVPQLQATYQGDFDGFFDSPDYKATQEQGLSFLDRSAAARGGLYSGGHDADLLKYGSNLGAMQIGNYRSGLAQLAGFGQSSAQNLGAAGMGMANSIGNVGLGMGNARASAYGQRADANGQLAAGLGGMFNNWYQQNRANNPGGTGWYLGNNPGRG